MKRLAILLILLFSSFFLYSQSEEQLQEKLLEIKNAHEQAYFNFSKEAYMKIWNDCERLISVYPDNELAKYYASYTAYRIANISMMNNDMASAEQFIKTGLAYTDSLKGKGQTGIEAKIIAAYINMMKLASDKEDAAALSAKVNSLIESALEEDEDNPRALLAKGMMAVNTPQQYGGSPEQAVKILNRAAGNFSNQDVERFIDWGEPEILAWTGIAYQKLGDNEQAKKVFEGALEKYPQFGWVKYKLLPSVK